MHSIARTPTFAGSPTAPSRNRSDLATQAWDRLRNDIISGVLPAGSRLRIAALSDTYGLSASPLREALNRLSSEGLVRSEERRGFFVPPADPRELRELTDLRKLVETDAIRRSMIHGDDRWEAGIVAASHRLKCGLNRGLKSSDGNAQPQAGEWELLNREFHEALLAACDSAWLLQVWRTVYDCMLRYRSICAAHDLPGGAGEREHEALQDAVLARDFDAARQLLDEHLEHAYGNFIALPRAEP